MKTPAIFGRLIAALFAAAASVIIAAYPVDATACRPSVELGPEDLADRSIVLVVTPADPAVRTASIAVDEAPDKPYETQLQRVDVVEVLSDHEVEIESTIEVAPHFVDQHLARHRRAATTKGRIEGCVSGLVYRAPPDERSGSFSNCEDCKLIAFVGEHERFGYRFAAANALDRYRPNLVTRIVDALAKAESDSEQSPDKDGNLVDDKLQRLMMGDP